MDLTNVSARRSWVGIVLFLVLASDAEAESRRRRAVRVPAPPVLRFFGDRFLTAARSTVFDPRGPMTLELEIHPTSHVPLHAPLITYTSPSAGALYEISMRRDDDGEILALSFADASGAPCCIHVSDRVNLARRKWIHVAAVLDGQLARLYLNGVEIGRTAMSGFPPVPSDIEPLRIGRSFPGGIRQVRIWRRALAADEIARIAETQDPLSSADLGAHWPLREGSGQSPRDLGPNGIALVLGETTEKEVTDPFWIAAQTLAEGPYYEPQILPTAILYDSLTGGEGVVVDASGDGRPDWFALPPIPYDRFICDAPHYAGAAPEQGSRYRNRGDGSLVLDPSIVTFDRFSTPFRVWVRDFTRDGRQDVLLVDSGPESYYYDQDCGVTGVVDDRDFPGGQSRLLVAQPDGRLVEETATRMPRRVAFDHGSAVGDVDGDGDLDAVFVPSFYFATDCLDPEFKPGARCPTVLVNDGNGSFQEDFSRLPDSIRRLNIDGPHVYFSSAAFLDVDRDGDQDLVLGRMLPNGGPNQLLLNDGRGFFSAAPEEAMPPGDPAEHVIWLDSADFDRDGWPDLIGTSYHRIDLMFNDRNGTFRNGNAALPPGESDEGAGHCDAADLNADGVPDILCSEPELGAMRLLFNRGDGTFARMPPIDEIEGGSDAYAVDANGDGLIDIMGSTGKPQILLQRKPYRAAE